MTIPIAQTIVNIACFLSKQASVHPTKKPWSLVETASDEAPRGEVR